MKIQTKYAGTLSGIELSTGVCKIRKNATFIKKVVI
jgi:hypothetical protein